MSKNHINNKELNIGARPQILSFLRSDPGLAVSLFVVLVAFSVGDIATDLAQGASWRHLVFESGVIAFSVFGMALFLARNRQTTRALLEERRKRRLLEGETSELRSANHRLSGDFADAVESQLKAWHLSAAENDVAIFLLKGMTLSEIADLRKTSEKTIKQQCSSIYAKSGLAGRAELSAFFLVEILNRN
jgi:DNA-binding CsgD family transcriptional regulator